VAVLTPLALCTDMLQASKTVTGSQVLPVMAKLIAHSESTYPVKYNKEVLQLTIEVAAAREEMHRDLVRRYCTDAPTDKLEDWIVAMMLDPRYDAL
jgi:hypothetical protein